jgi:hypothetical protein
LKKPGLHSEQVYSEEHFLQEEEHLKQEEEAEAVVVAA